MINIVVAMPCEAKPLVEYFSLCRNSQLHAFPVYETDAMTLIASGVGKVNSAAAVAWLAGIQQSSDTIWLNLGMAGHTSLAPGTVLLANKVTDMTTKRSWYPQALFRVNNDSTALITVDEVIDDYPPDAMIDMEAAGFMAAAEKFSTLENIHLVKVISDNRLTPAKLVSKTSIDSLLRKQLPGIEQLINALREVSQNDSTDTGIAAVMALCQQHRHFSSYQQSHQKKLLRRLQALNLLTDITPASLQDCRSGKAVIQQLEAMLAEQVYHITQS